MNQIVAEKRYIQAKLGIRYSDLSQSYLRSEVALGNDSTINFVLQANKKTDSIVTERLLELNDEFVITHLFFGLKQIAADAPTSAQHLAAQIYTWENPEVFSGTNASNVPAIYNADMSWTIDRKEYVPQFPMRAFRRVPTTQTGTDIGYTSSGQNTVDGFANGLYAFYPSEPTKINGRQTVELTINLGAAVNFDDASNSVWAVCEARGYLAVNTKN